MISTIRRPCPTGLRTLSSVAYDPDQAKSLLKKAGAEGLSVNLSVADSVYSGAVDMCVLYAEQAKAAGININVIREPNDGYYSDVWLKKPWCAVQWGARPTPDVMYSLAYKDDAAWNESHWKNPRFNELAARGQGRIGRHKTSRECIAKWRCWRVTMAEPSSRSSRISFMHDATTSNTPGALPLAGKWTVPAPLAAGGLNLKSMVTIHREIP